MRISGPSERLPDLVSATLPAATGGESAGAALRQWMGLRVGDLQLLIPADAGREVIPPPSISRLPHTASWLRGLANVRGTLVPVLDLAPLLQTAAGGAPRRPYLLISGHGDAAIGLLIDGLPRLMDFDPGDRPLSSPPQVVPLLRDSVIAAYERDGGVWLEVDLAILFDNVARGVATQGTCPASEEST